MKEDVWHFVGAKHCTGSRICGAVAAESLVIAACRLLPQAPKGRNASIPRQHRAALRARFEGDSAPEKRRRAPLPGHGPRAQAGGLAARPNHVEVGSLADRTVDTIGVLIG